MKPSAPSLDQLKQVSVFSELDADTLRLLQEQMQPASFGPGQVICREGETGDRMFIIQSGQVAVFKQGPAGREVEVATLLPGEIAGDLSLYGPAQRSATLRAKTETCIWVLEHAPFAALIERHGALAKALLHRLGRHLRRETSVVARLLSQDLERRFKVVCFDSKPYVEAIFRERNRYDCALQFCESRLTQETVAMAAGFRAVCVFVNDDVGAEVVQELKDLGVELIALRCAGFNNVDLAACERLGLAVTRVPAYSPHAVAEHAVALMLALNRRIHRAHNRVREGNFSLTGLIGFNMHGKTAGIVGTGKIGKCLAHILAGMGCRLLAYDCFPDAQLVDRLGVRYVGLAELLAESDIISLHAPLTRDTHHLINQTAIARMKRGVMLINTSRGALIDTPALLRGLKSGQIGYAGLDVYEEESEYFFEDFSNEVIADDVLARLMTFHNVIVTGHQGFLTHEALCSIADVTFENIHEFELGRRGDALTNRAK